VSRRKKLLFAALTFLGVFGAIEVVAQMIWFGLESRAFSRTRRQGEEVLRNDLIHFMKVADGHYGFVLKPGFSRGGSVVNEQGFGQREVISIERRPGTLRFVAMGESTTLGHDVDNGNYPVYLRDVMKISGRGFSAVEMINAGVSGWLSDQVALRAERELVAYKPDIVVLYVGWNDFQSYDPYSPPPTISHFERVYGPAIVRDTFGLKSVELLSAWLFAAKARLREVAFSLPSGADIDRFSARETYRFFLGNLHRIVHAFRAADPNVKLVLCTLAGRWPQGSWEEFAVKPNGQTWWIKRHNLTPVQAAAALERFNDLIREYGRAQGLLLVDVAEVFSRLDRASLQWDFAHMHAEGYEIIAEAIYQALLNARAVEGERSGRLEALTGKYELRSK